MRNKHILILNRSFWPDVEATGQFLTELSEELAQRYKVTVIAGRSYFTERSSDGWKGFYNREIFNGMEIIRVKHTRLWKGNLWARIVNWLTFSILAFFAGLKIKTDLIIACTDPPFLGIMALALSRLKKIPYIYNCRDLFPEVAIALGKLKKTNPLSIIYDYLNTITMRSARLIVCLGESMSSRLSAKGISSARIKVIPDWVDTDEIRPVLKTEKKFVLMYSGNLGLVQDFDALLKAVAMIKERDLFNLIFVGEGVLKKEIKEEAAALGLNNVLFLPYQAKESLSFSLSLANLHLVPLKKGFAGIVVPSKIYGIMAAGRPYLAITDGESEPARLAEEFNCGLWAAPGDANSISERINWALTHHDELEEMGRSARHIAETKFDKRLVVDEWFKVLDGL